jgi:hypothetical protein
VSVSALGQPALAEPHHKARLVSCDGGDCLLLSGTRGSSDAPVRVNGHLVGAEGGRGWKVLLPVQNVREWSLPGARSIAVTTQDPDSQDSVVNQVDLPIGMLGSITELAYLVIPQR